MPRQFEHLREPLLRAGIAPRHVRRYLTELAEHFDDAVREEEQGGASRAAAERAARARIGGDEHLVQSALARPELRALTTRFPGLIFGAGPVVAYILVIVGVTVALANFADLPHGPVSDSYAAGATAICMFFARVLPAAIALTMVGLAVQRHALSRWPLIGAAIIALVSGTTDITTHFPAVAGGQGDLQIYSRLIPMFSAPFTDALGTLRPAALATGLLRAGLIFAIALSPYALRQKKTVSR